MASSLGCATSPPSAPAASGSGSPAATHVVRREETLYRIATRHGLDWRDVARRNGIGPPYLIYPGQRIRLAGAAPMDSPRATEAPGPAARPAPSQPAPQQAGARAPAVAAPSAAEPAREPAGATGPPQWQWPVDGPVLRGFSNGATTRRGIAIGGEGGEDVRAAAAGEVVYAGSGLVGYGRLIILKHDARFISAYGHNEELLVREGQNVRAGERMARLGDSGAERPMLHFEIRLDGAAVDPTRYLPRR
ncbi:peptidoglycan DD-metalloendopeptidase family protein [Thioalkalivibrio sp.]|uniref:peptidoglycan DD-metalloendopeptidase family protein n=1 Tax=Thioalkalivibrio sp. TaxID=2093813 RepID=UPI00356765EA